MQSPPVPMPRLGAPLADGRFAGIVRDPNSDQDVALVDLGLSDGRMTFDAAMKHAAERGAFVPTREEARVLWANLDSRAAVSLGWFWTSTQYAGNAAYAWMQLFVDGPQNYGHKSTVYRARAVRRLPLQSFNDSVIQSVAAREAAGAEA